MTNFDFLTSDPQFDPFSSVAVSAERILPIDPSAAVLNCRRAMEFAVKWMYAVDGELVKPWQDNLKSLMDDEVFRAIVGTDIWRRMKFIRQTGNDAAHSGKVITRAQAVLCLENLFVFLDFVACCYGKSYEVRAFDKTLLEKPSQSAFGLTALPGGELSVGRPSQSPHGAVTALPEGEPRKMFLFFKGVFKGELGKMFSFESCFP